MPTRYNGNMLVFKIGIDMSACRTVRSSHHSLFDFGSCRSVK